MLLDLLANIMLCKRIMHSTDTIIVILFMTRKKHKAYSTVSFAHVKFLSASFYSLSLTNLSQFYRFHSLTIFIKN